MIRSGGEGEAYARRVENLLKREARDTLLERTDHHLRTLGQAPVKVSIADTRSRWGSCSPHNRTIRYSWRVVMAPPPVIDYLAAHRGRPSGPRRSQPGLLVGGRAAGRGSSAMAQMA